jgi:exosortase D (VPLPA-CTERM-specific)
MRLPGSFRKYKVNRVTTPGPGPAASPLDAASWRFSPRGFAVLAFALLVAFVPFSRVLVGLYGAWNLRPEYSYAVIIPFISLFLIWRERDALVHTPFRGSWLGVLQVLLGVLMWLLAELSTIYIIAQYAFLVVVAGLLLALAGGVAFRRIRVPLLLLLFVIPLPAFFGNSLSLRLQLWSSAIGVAVIRLAGISVYLDGNVIDLGSYKLQVAEACSGLSYLFPLMALACLIAYLYKAALWKRIALFLASIPIAVLMNSLRIGVIGITVEHWGPRMAEGVLHWFEGWVVFMICTLVLLGFAAVLSRIGPHPVRLREALTLDSGPPLRRNGVDRERTLPKPFVAATAVAAAAAAASLFMPERVELRPVRTPFVQFPLQLGGWQGTRAALEAVYLNQLKLDDYLLADYHGAGLTPVNVWIAYYDSQRKGQSAHSPRSCLPGGGWDFETLGPRRLDTSPGALTVNRGIIRHGTERELVYYWFQQRGRMVTNEYLVKWYILTDAITRNRTDGAMVRVLAPLPAGVNEAQVERDLTRFAAALSGQLSRYVPN